MADPRPNSREVASGRDNVIGRATPVASRLANEDEYLNAYAEFMCSCLNPLHQWSGKILREIHVQNLMDEKRRIVGLPPMDVPEPDWQDIANFLLERQERKSEQKKDKRIIKQQVLTPENFSPRFPKDAVNSTFINNLASIFSQQNSENHQEKKSTTSMISTSLDLIPNLDSTLPLHKSPVHEFPSDPNFQSLDKINSPKRIDTSASAKDKKTHLPLRETPKPVAERKRKLLTNLAAQERKRNELKKKAIAPLEPVQSTPSGLFVKDLTLQKIYSVESYTFSNSEEERIVHSSKKSESGTQPQYVLVSRNRFKYLPGSDPITRQSRSTQQ